MSRLLKKCQLVFVILSLLIALPALAQDEEEEDSPTRTAVMSHNLRHDGTMNVNFYSTVAIDRMEELTQALSTALHCDASAFRPPDYSYSVTDPEQQKQIRRAQKQAAQRQSNAVCTSSVEHHQMQSSLAIALGPAP